MQNGKGYAFVFRYGGLRRMKRSKFLIFKAFYNFAHNIILARSGPNFTQMTGYRANR